MSHTKITTQLCLYNIPSSKAMDIKLRLVQFETNGSSQRVGVQLQDRGSVVDVCAAEPSLPRDMRSFLQGWETNLPLAAKYVARHHLFSPSDHQILH